MVWLMQTAKKLLRLSGSGKAQARQWRIEIKGSFHVAEKSRRLAVI